MTRINIVDPKELSDLHLRAEIREIVRIVAYLRKDNGESTIPDSYTLGKGHVRFFYNKLDYILLRYRALLGEYLARFSKYPKTYRELKWELRLIKDKYFQIMYFPTESEIEINRARITDRILHGKAIHRTTLKQKELT